MLLRSLLLILSLGSVLSVQAVPETPDDYLKIFQTGIYIEQEAAAKNLSWAGISSPKLFDLIEQKTLESLPLARERASVNYTAWLTKALAYSGNEKYRVTIQKVILEAPHKKLKKHAINALKDLDKYAKINPLIAPRAWPEFEHPSTNQRLLNMLNSDNSELMLFAAKKIHFTQNYQSELLNALSNRIESTYAGTMGKDRMEAIAWMCRALAGSRSMEHRAILEKVAADASDKKLRSHARKFLAKY